MGFQDVRQGRQWVHRPGRDDRDHRDFVRNGRRVKGLSVSPRLCFVILLYDQMKRKELKDASNLVPHVVCQSLGPTYSSRLSIIFMKPTFSV